MMHNCPMFEGYNNYAALRQTLLDWRTGPIWTGKLASSALSTALTYVVLGAEARTSLRWLLDHVNADGGWGDTPESISNLSTTLIVRDSLIYAERNNLCGLYRDRVDHARQRADAWIEAQASGLSIDAIVAALSRIYGHDRTFAVPILAFHAIATGEPGCWGKIPPLPFLFALLPRGFYRLLRLHVVSYALPALIAVGLCRSLAKAREKHRFTWAQYVAPTLLRKLQTLQPCHGGFLDASPLTAFVCLALRHAGFDDHIVYVQGLQFLRTSIRDDGSTAIDSNLRTWVTSLAVRSLLIDHETTDDLTQQDREKIIRWYCETQHRIVHPFTGSAPGGWAWTDLPGGVPDADDTSAALIALHLLCASHPTADIARAVHDGLAWLLSIQNRDGGIPTFCRGWGKLAFDQSCPDITAHALHACARWLSVFSPDIAQPRMREQLQKAIAKMIQYLHNSQHLDGRWEALWFGHQYTLQGKNPIVGTARVIDALNYAQQYGVVHPRLAHMTQLGREWLEAQQGEHGAWSMGETGTTEETALATIALVNTPEDVAARRGGAWLKSYPTESLCIPAPIGLYFALLWYHEQLYPLVWALEALEKLENGTTNG